MMFEQHRDLFDGQKYDVPAIFAAHGMKKALSRFRVRRVA